MLTIACRFRHDSEAEAVRHAGLLGARRELGVDRVWSVSRVEARRESYDYIDTMPIRWEHLPAPGWCPCHGGEACPGGLVRHEGESCEWRCGAHRWLLEDRAPVERNGLDVGGVGW